ncbi:unnamed protein product [Lactuca virosa]|uniref:Uncharacterized protein n=1 Tax=Lactuca virosa TaxID=75947 RepID=A0AAU9M162_9ASTR|nr:unnamed protein product [Lactuca virosa]
MFPTRRRLLTYLLKIRLTDHSIGFADLGCIYIESFFTHVSVGILTTEKKPIPPVSLWFFFAGQCCFEHLCCSASEFYDK